MTKADDAWMHHADTVMTTPSRMTRSASRHCAMPATMHACHIACEPSIHAVLVKKHLEGVKKRTSTDALKPTGPFSTRSEEALRDVRRVENDPERTGRESGDDWS